ncbi:unnamed protein product [Calicophoron daubneyi]|uniref:RabBD domain-containing protein n=1 Tax=Calicophoron daubneyi TaxID=300641 RepID=A0AAV2SY81_CALDB
MEAINNGYSSPRTRGNQPSRLSQKASVDGYRTLPSRLQPQTSSNGGDMAVLQSALDKVDLSYLSDEERAKLLGVVQRDLEIRAAEKQRLNRFRSSILRHDREAAAKSQNTVAESNNCLLCGRKFYVLFQPKQICSSCQRPVCRQCSEQIPGTEKVLCSLCVRETGYRAMKCNWFYDTVLTRFREFGSTTVVKNLFGNKYQLFRSP